jgi:hypothetical protein
MEDKTFTRGVSVPDAVLGMLRKDERVLSYLQAIDKTPQELTTEPFVASEIHLSGSEEKDLIVMGTDGLLGANVTPFWVFRKRSSGYQLVLHVFAHDLKVENARSAGMRNISTGTATSQAGTISLYKFYRGGYHLANSKSESLG